MASSKTITRMLVAETDDDYGIDTLIIPHSIGICKPMFLPAVPDLDNQWPQNVAVGPLANISDRPTRQRYYIYDSLEIAIREGWPDAEYGWWTTSVGSTNGRHGWIALDGLIPTP